MKRVLDGGLVPGRLQTSPAAVAEAVRFELTKGCPLPVFKTGALNRSATPPKSGRIPSEPPFFARRALFRVDLPASMPPAADAVKRDQQAACLDRRYRA